MFDLSTVTKYIVPSATNHILAALERYNPDKDIIDLANVYLLFNANDVLRILMNKGYKLTNSKDDFVTAILQKKKLLYQNLQR